MGLDNRDYLRDEARRYGEGGGFGGGGFGGSPMSPICKRLIIINVVVFVAQLFTTGNYNADQLEEFRQRQIVALETMKEDLGGLEDSDQRLLDRYKSGPLPPSAAERLRMPKTSLAESWLQLETPKVLRGQVWRLITCAFCHSRDNLFHILFNMLFLFWFGPRLETMYGQKEFLWFYMMSALSASLCYIGIDLLTGDPVPMLGASGAIMGVTLLFAWHFPDHTIHLFFIIPVTMRWVVFLYAVFDLFPLLQQLSGNSVAGTDNVAHAAHLGGLAFGYLYASKQWRLAQWGDWLSTKFKARQRGFRVVSAESEGRPSRKSEKLAEEMDAILQKISEQGEASLTSAERKTLEKASRELRNRG